MFEDAIIKVWNIGDATMRIAVVEEFLTASSKKDYEELCTGYPFLFGVMAPEQTPSDVAEICKLLNMANETFALYQTGGPITVDDIYSCGLSARFFGLGKADARPEEMSWNSYSLGFYYRISSPRYARWLQDASNKLAGRVGNIPHMAIEYDGGSLYYNADIRKMGDFIDAREDAAEILRQIFNIHLSDIATVCGISTFSDPPSMSQAHVPFSGVSALWLGLSERMSAGRSFRCEACGKPSVAYAERRRKRFCCDACRKWASANPGKMRTSWYIEKR